MMNSSIRPVREGGGKPPSGGRSASSAAASTTRSPSVSVHPGRPIPPPLAPRPVRVAHPIAARGARDEQAPPERERLSNPAGPILQQCGPEHRRARSRALDRPDRDELEAPRGPEIDIADAAEPGLQDAAGRRSVVRLVADPVAGAARPLVAQDRLEEARADAAPTPPLRGLEAPQIPLAGREREGES